MKYTPTHNLPLIEPAVDTIRSGSGDNLWKQLNASMTAVDAALTKELASTLRFRGALPSGADLNTYQGEAYAGIWSAPTSGIVASLLNAPPGLNPFTVEVRPNTNGITKQVLSSYGSTFGTWSRGTNSLTGNNWTPWKQDAYKGENPVITLADGTDLNTLLEYNDYQVLTSGKAATLLNTPDANPFVLQVRPMVGQAIITQTLISSGGSGNYWYRVTNSVTNGNWTPWRALHTQPSASEPSGPYQRDMLVSAFTQRRGGVIGTSGKPAVALRFDHGLGNFRDIILPLLRKYNLPWSQVVNSRNIARAENGGMSWAELESRALAYGGEVWNHGATHGDANTEAAIRDEIVNGLTELKALFPRLAIEGWAPPGLADGGYMGAAGFDLPEQFYGTYAGRLMMAHHAGVVGYIPGSYRPMPQSLPIGSTHVTMDRATAATMRNTLNAISNYSSPVAVQLMLHPSLVGTADYMTAETVDEVFADIARRRDAGELFVLSPSGLLLTDHRTSQRDDLLVNGNFVGSAAGWGADGWEWVADSGGGSVSTSGNQPLAQSFNLYRRTHLKGGMRDLELEVRSPEGGSLAVTIEGAGVAVNRTCPVPAGTGWRTFHAVFTLPANMTDENVTVSVQRASGANIAVRRAALLAI